MLDQIISKTFQICYKIENKDVYVDMSTVLVSHFKEYRKALKRHEKTPTHPIVSHYKKIHPISESMQKYSTADHCTNILRIVFKDLVPWELWDTPHSELLVRIMAKKLDSYIDSTLTDPVWLNDKLLKLLNAKSNAKTLKKPDVPKPEVKEAAISPKLKPDTTSIETALSTVITKSTAPILQRALNDDEKPVKLEGIVEEKAVISEPVEIRSSPVLRQRRGRQGRNEVKIYDRVIEGSVKTWETDIDLQCISLGQDLLASLDGEMTLSRLWGNEPEAEGSPNPPRCKSPQPLWFGEEDQLDMDLTDTSPQRESRKEQSPKPSETLLKDLQSTVYQAKTKIGDLQVRNVPIDVQRKHNTDEAAGMMEGLLDFGIAGLKKGLRFTGLSDDSQEKSPSHHAKTSDKSPSEVRRSIPEYKETGITTLLQREENLTAPPLLKQHRVISQDSVPSQAKPVPIVRGEFPAPAVPLPDSPEPVYEEAADLSTSIAKLRCLLQQRALLCLNSSLWWLKKRFISECAVELFDLIPPTPFHLRTTRRSDEYDMNIDRNSSPGQTSNNMQRLDKLFQRTVTGVFNSIKTAVGAEGEEADTSSARQIHDWEYVCTSVELSVGGAVARLVGSRRAFTHVDAALDSLEQLQPSPRKREATPDDFEEWCAVHGCGWCALCEVASAIGLTHSHVTHRIATLLFADLAESLIDVWLEDFTTWLKQQVFVIFENMSDKGTEVPSKMQEEMADFNINVTCDAIMEKVPLLLVFGEETLSTAIKLSISSFSHKEINKDVVYRMLDVLTLHFKKSASQRNPSFDSN
ncbi:hypothetical protein K1T71_011626 [Dendrolimus kikuchii]|uniref:Uncharacterized protein n=1 Tax=Dendrolimus kikuchii TaxID=765133 RepID=A0ACC1CLN8_9NEOP|nr:hypothetical protein K1T71_011626 [Dendrolimus kikuchii]